MSDCATAEMAHALDALQEATLGLARAKPGEWDENLLAAAIMHQSNCFEELVRLTRTPNALPQPVIAAIHGVQEVALLAAQSLLADIRGEIEQIRRARSTNRRLQAAGEPPARYISRRV